MRAPSAGPPQRSREHGGRLRPSPAARWARHVALALGGAALLCGCIGDPPPEPEVQPLEIVAGNPDPDFGPCLLNVDEVGAGTHEVVALSMGGAVTVRILDPSGAVVFERALDEQAAEGGGYEVQEEDEGSVRLQAGEHRVECTLPDGTSSTELLVRPARPGFEQDVPA